MLLSEFSSSLDTCVFELMNVDSIDNEKIPLAHANIARGDGKWVKDTNRLLASSLDSASSIDVVNTLSGHDQEMISPLSTPSTSPSSSMASSAPSFSKYSMMNKSKSSFAAPMLSPASSTDSLDFFGSAGTTFLESVFPASEIGRTALPVESKLSGWNLALVEDDDARTVYAKGQCGLDVCNRETVIALLDHADEDLECDQVVVVLDKKNANLGLLSL